jgi:phosphatidylglycerophosphate synthase
MGWATTMGNGTDTYEVGDRRPLASRQTRWADRSAAFLAERNVSPNAISIAGMFFGILAGAFLAATPYVDSIPRRILFLLAVAAVQFRLLCNLFDGMVAVKTHRASRTGELFNEIPDRVSDPATLIGAGFALGGLPWLGYLAAIMALFTAYVRAVGKVAGAQQEFCGPMAKQQRMAVVTIVSLYCALVPQRWQGGWTSHGFGIMAVALAVIVAGSVITVFRRLFKISHTLKNSTR